MNLSINLFNQWINSFEIKDSQELKDLMVLKDLIELKIKDHNENVLIKQLTDEIFSQDYGFTWTNIPVNVTKLCPEIGSVMLPVNVFIKTYDKINGSHPIACGIATDQNDWVSYTGYQVNERDIDMSKIYDIQWDSDDGHNFDVMFGNCRIDVQVLYKKYQKSEHMTEFNSFDKDGNVESWEIDTHDIRLYRCGDLTMDKCKMQDLFILNRGEHSDHDSDNNDSKLTQQ